MSDTDGDVTKYHNVRFAGQETAWAAECNRHPLPSSSAPQIWDGRLGRLLYVFSLQKPKSDQDPEIHAVADRLRGVSNDTFVDPHPRGQLRGNRYRYPLHVSMKAKTVVSALSSLVLLFVVVTLLS